MKKTLAITLTIMLLLSTLPMGVFSITASAATDGYYTYTVSDGEVTITDCDTYISGDVTVPSTLGGYSVTRIGDSAFHSCSGILSVTIPDSIMHIGKSAFLGCIGLTSITIPNSVTSIGNSAFVNCTGLTTVNFNATNCTTMGSYDYPVFEGCQNLKTVNIGDNVQIIPDYAFYNCVGLTGITIPNSVTSIGNYAFSDCAGLTSITIPNSVTSIGSSAFEDCYDLTSITIPDSVTSIGDYAFKGCIDLISVTIGNSVTSIGYSAFYCCARLTSITIPDSVTSIGGFAFSYCTRLTNVTIGNGVRSIGNYAFNDCTDLTSITIPDSVTSIGDYAFSDCIDLTSVFIGNGVRIIGNSAFKGCDDLVNITIPNRVTSIGSSAFEGCTDLTSIIIPNSVTSIGNSAFRDCTRLISVTIGNSVKDIGNYAFSDCTNLTSITIPDGVTSIGDHAFNDCTGFTSVAIGNGVERIGNYAFSYCAGFTSVTIPNSVTSMGNYAFYGCTGLTTVNFNATNCTYMGSSDPVFEGCENLKTLIIGDNVQTIPNYAFKNCTALTSVTIPNSVTSIGNSAFASCTSLTIVDFNATNCTTMGSSSRPVFAECANLKTIIIGDNVQAIPDYAFKNCTALTSVTITNSVKKIGDSAFFCTPLINVYYLGTETQKENISIGVENEELMDAAWHYVYEDCNVGNHTYDHDCDRVCNLCGETRITSHKYSNGCDKDCNVCGETRVTSHKYSNNCDASCNVCGATRTAPHSYKTSVTKATTSKNGKITKTCSGCKKKVTSTIYYAKSFSLSKTSFTYNGKVQTPTVTVKDAKGKVIDPKYYTLSYSSGRKNVGTYKIKVTLKGNYSGSKTLSYKIKPISITKCKVSISGTSYTYNGKTIKPSVKVLSAGGSTLKNGTHYTVSYSKGCKAPGTYKVTVKMKGAYSGSKSFTYKINPISISKCKVSISGTSYYYNGKVIKPSVKVQTASGSTLKNGTHYTVSYSSGCKNPGTYKVVVKMKETYSGSKTFTYTIKPLIKISTCQVSLSSTAYTYNGKTQTPSVKVVNAEGTTLKNGTHYTVSYSSGRKNIGTYKVVVKMKGIYTGSKTLTYKINPISISKCKVSISATSYTYDGKVKTPSVKVLSAGGSTLKNGTHYTVSYSSGRINVGTYKVVVKMKGTYSGSQTFTFDILPPKTSITSLVENGKTVKVDFAKKTVQVTGYEIQYATDADFTDALTMTIADYNTTSATITELKSGATYYVRVRTYKTVSGVKYYSGWSTVKSIKTTGFLPDNNAGWIPGWY